MNWNPFPPFSLALYPQTICFVSLYILPESFYPIYLYICWHLAIKHGNQVCKISIFCGTRPKNYNCLNLNWPFHLELIHLLDLVHISPSSLTKSNFSSLATDQPNEKCKIQTEPDILAWTASAQYCFDWRIFYLQNISQNLTLKELNLVTKSVYDT